MSNLPPPPSFALFENRDLVAEVCIQALFSSESKDKIVELYENEDDGAVALPKEKWF